MSINIEQDKRLAEMLPEVLKMRTVIKGAPFVKAQGDTYLPSPNEVDKTSAQATTQYNKYKAGAEFDEYTSQTSTSMIGKLNLDDFTPELDGSIEYLINDVDGDGCSLKGLTESLATNILAVKWHIAAVDYKGLQGVALEDVSVADAEILNPRAAIKQYARESVVKAYFSTINGHKQLSFIMLLEVGEKFNQENYETNIVKSYLILALDESGNYYQQKLVQDDEGGILEGVRDYVTVSESPLKFIPLEIVSDQEICHELPLELGFLNPIADLCLHRYNVSADYKEALRKFVPTTDVFGMNDNDLEMFTTVNKRSYRAIGQTNLWPSGDITIQTSSTEGSLESFENYDTSSKEKIRSIGGVVPEYSTGDTSATEAVINSNEQNSVLNPLVSNVEESVCMLIAYCAMFEGLTTQENVNEYASTVMFDMPREFSKVAPNVESGRFVIEMINSRLMTTEQATKKLIAMGWHEGDIEEILSDIENIEPDISIPDNNNMTVN
ncbi:DUF4055 domain-containing protein [Porticoccaceae bacterium]|nr:DUF4055 domain-containing protein [Porticoccaceae bacterium]